RSQLGLVADLIAQLHQVRFGDLIDVYIHYDLCTVFVQRIDQFRDQLDIFFGIADGDAVRRVVLKNDGLAAAGLCRDRRLDNSLDVLRIGIGKVESSQNQLLEICAAVVIANKYCPQTDSLKKQVFLQEKIIERLRGGHIL